jgi:type IV secretion system protein VirB10
MRALLALAVFSAVAFAQQAPVSPQDNRIQPVTAPAAPALTDPSATPATTPSVRQVPASSPNAEAYTVAAGTRIPVTLKHAISTKNARENDPIYAETAFPVVLNGHVVIPVGTYVQGVVQRSKRPGHIKGHGELVLHFNTLIFPSGYTLLLPGSIDNVPGAEQAKMKDEEGTMENGSGSKVQPKDIPTVIEAGAAGAGIGAIATGGSRGAALGGGLIGAGAGLASVLLTRGPDVRIESGAMVEMVLERDITVEHSRVGPSDTQNVRIVR